MKRPRTDDCPELTTEIVAVMADDDYVTVLWPRTYPDPRAPTNADGSPSKTYSTSWFDTWRFVDGKADEHWDPAMIPPPAPPATN
jgi:predicted SnoaL-like aldol condensation-catalyzing enzyme